MSLDILDTFVPPKPDDYRWATFLPGRNAHFKVHKTLGNAKAAFNSLSQTGILYELMDLEWVERFRLTQEDINAQQCYRCGAERYSYKVEWRTVASGDIEAVVRCGGRCNHGIQ